ncbi:hypothetical protein EB118_07080 [bacterium]|nr:hypothetical protein [bacterium]NDD82925.1 hypothetical protein [bacterium]NDG29844.1 hypothetical protein [bacterium]
MDPYFYTDIPVYDNGTWTTTSFSSRDDFRDFALSIFKEPGEYQFNDTTSKVFNEQATTFRQQGFYCSAPEGTKDFRKYWDDQKTKNRKGIIVKDGNLEWYLTRDYYMWLNFLPIFNKEIQKFGFADIRDAQYHIALYELLAELHYQHSSILKKRQIASSYFHAAKLINQIWYEEGVTLKMGASLKDYINEKGTWKFLNEYEAFLNTHTAWYRPMNPNKVLFWQQKIETETYFGGRKRKSEIGLKGVIQGMSFEKDPTNGVGGPVKYFFHEEAGIAPKMDQTYGYIKPALKSGLITTGMFIAAGSVGDLDQCEPLKDMIMNPDGNDIYAVETNLIDDKGTIGRSGLFIPEQWSMPPYIDKHGNSLVAEALDALNKYFEDCKKKMSPEAYQLEVSQHPRNIKEAFDFRTLSVFPSHLISAQMRRIEEKEYSYEHLDIYRGTDGNPAVAETSKLPIREFPITKNTEDKTGCLVVWERPVKDPEFGTYYASIDPVGEGKTTTSESLCSIYVYKTAIEITKNNGEKVETYIEQDKLVAAWCGRFDDINKTHERLELIIEWYNAWTIVENNISQFINHMIYRKKQRYLVPRSQILFLKDIGANANVFQEYGWKNTGTLFKSHMLSYAIEFVKEELDTLTDDNGKPLKTIFGIERIPDPMLLKEMMAYRDGVNVDRLVSFAALVAFAKVQQANRGYKKRYEETGGKKLDNSRNFSKLNSNPFRHMGGSGNKFPGMPIPRSPFKNLR